MLRRPDQFGSAQMKRILLVGLVAGQLVWDSTGNPHVLYVDGTDGVLRHAWRSGASTWSHEIVDGNFTLGKTEVGGYEAASDGAGGLYMLYRRVDVKTYLGDVQYAHLSGGAWTITPLVLPQYLVPPMQVDPSGTLWLAYESTPSSGHYQVNLMPLRGGT